jgi:hypothetical protein
MEAHGIEIEGMKSLAASGDAGAAREDAAKTE